jgi:hypothetical protein
LLLLRDPPDRDFVAERLLRDEDDGARDFMRGGALRLGDRTVLRPLDDRLRGDDLIAPRDRVVGCLLLGAYTRRVGVYVPLRTRDELDHVLGT